MTDKKPSTADEPAKPTGLDLLRMPFPAHQISKLPKPTKAQTEAVKADFKAGVRCDICGTWHHPKVVHLDYVGHAALTDRLLDADPHWYWEPLAFDQTGLPAFGPDKGLWIRLYVCGHSRIGFGSADGKTGGDAVKEIIGDALRNAAMRFGAALDLWHKGDLHAIEEEEIKPAEPEMITEDQRIELMALFGSLNVPVAEFLKAAGGIKDLRQLEASRFDGAKTLINKRAKAVREQEQN